MSLAGGFGVPGGWITLSVSLERSLNPIWVYCSVIWKEDGNSFDKGNWYFLRRPYSGCSRYFLARVRASSGVSSEYVRSSLIHSLKVGVCSSFSGAVGV